MIDEQIHFRAIIFNVPGEHFEHELAHSKFIDESPRHVHPPWIDILGNAFDVSRHAAYVFCESVGGSVEKSYVLDGSLFLANGAKRSIGTGRNVVVLCSLEISRMVWRKRNCSAIGSLLIMAAACTIFSAA